MNELLAQPLALPCGAVLPNRLAKAAMTEGLATAAGVPGPALEQLYGLWADGGAGLLLTGNVQIDADHLERPGNVIIDREPAGEQAAALARWAAAATRAGNHCWVQLSHAGRQTMKPINPSPQAPSAVRVGLPGGQFGEPVPFTEAEVAALPARFARAARACQAAGFSGVQLHAAHGYLFSSFLSPRTNLREDRYGGSLENRARVLLETVAAVRAEVGPAFPLAVKLNSADFQKGGFAFSDSLQVARWLEAASVDLIEISGGTYEQPRLLDMEGLEPVAQQGVKASTLAREAYFVDFALAMQAEVNIPLMVTGGFRRRDAMEQALSGGAADVIGLGRPLCVATDGPARLLGGAGELPRFEQQLALLPGWLSFMNRSLSLRAVSGFAVMYWYYEQLVALGERGRPEPDLSVARASWRTLQRQRRLLAAR